MKNILCIFMLIFSGNSLAAMTIYSCLPDSKWWGRLVAGNQNATLYLYSREDSFINKKISTENGYIKLSYEQTTQRGGNIRWGSRPDGNEAEGNSTLCRVIYKMVLDSATATFAPKNGGTPIVFNTYLNLESYNENVGNITATRQGSYGQPCTGGCFQPAYGAVTTPTISFNRELSGLTANVPNGDYDLTITANIKYAFQVGPGAGRAPNHYDGDGQSNIIVPVTFPATSVTIRNGGAEDFKPASCSYVGKSAINFGSLSYNEADNAKKNVKLKMSCNREVSMMAILRRENVQLGNNWKAVMDFPRGSSSDGISPEIPLRATLVNINGQGKTGTIHGSVIVDIVYD